MKINLSPSGASRKNKWVVFLQQQWADEHDVKFDGWAKGYFETPGGAKALSEWLKSQGFDVHFWCVEPYIQYDSMKRKILSYIGFGLDFNEKCPKLTEIRLKHTK
jgi:hypothetical protein